MKSIPFSIMLLGVAGALPVSAVPIVYEPFNYPVGVLTGKNGGLGFSGGWVATRGTNMQGAVWDETTNAAFGTETPALIWNGLLSNGFPAFPLTGARYAGATNSGSSDMNISRTLATSAGAMAGADGVLWLSAVYHVANTGTGAGINIGLGNGYVYDRGRAYSTAVNGSASTTVSFIGVNGYTGSAWNTRVNPIVTAGSWTAGNYARTNGPTALITTADMIVMLKYTFGTSDTVEAAYFTENETVDEAAFNTRKVAATLAAGIDENALTVLSISQGRMANAVDEIRIGKTFADVTSPTPNFEYEEWAARYPGIGLPGDDNDGDGLTNQTEQPLGTNPLLADTDGDGDSDSAEVAAGSNPLAAQSTVADTDADALPDAWEMAAFGNLSQDGAADSDDDLLANALELQLGLNPAAVDSNGDGNPDWMGIPGYLYVEQWNNMPGATLDDLFASAAFHGQPDDVYLVSQSSALANVGDNYGLRMSGRVVAPVSGNYNFYISGDGQCELLLSTDASAFNRRSVASVTVGTGVNKWTVEAGQKSAPVALVAGQEYYIEALMKESDGADHVEVAWSYPGQGIQIIPAARLKSFMAEAGDADRDGLPDAWEIQVGMNPADNGATDRFQSAYADVDGDGLRNFEEYLYGGSPFIYGGDPNALEYSLWKAIDGEYISDLVRNPLFSAAPDYTTLLWPGASVSSLGTDVAGRLRGTITPTESGIYNLYISGNDQAELWLSPGPGRFDKERIAWVHSPVNSQVWTSEPTQVSAPIHMQAGQSYYLEALVKNDASTSQVSVGWSKYPEPVTATLPWRQDDPGLSSPAAWTANGTDASVTATGGNLFSNQDAMTLRSAAISGDFMITARLTSLNATGGTVAQGDIGGAAQAGITIRESTDAGSRHVTLLKTTDDRLMVISRGLADAQMSYHVVTVPGFGNEWLRLVKTGNRLSGFTSPDGVKWSSCQGANITMDSVIVGLVASGSTATVTATYGDVAVVPAAQPVLIPRSVLKSVTKDAADVDDDNLPDSWETQMALNATTGEAQMGEHGDPDGDGVGNFYEFRHGGDPRQAQGIAGHLTHDSWSREEGQTLYDFVRSTGFLEGPDHSELIDGPEFYDYVSANGFANRIRGRLVAPVTGQYRFWIAGNDDYELWLSKDSRPCNKRKVASAKQYVGGVQSALFMRDWDRFTSQASSPVQLVAGESYFIEVLHKVSGRRGYFSVAWSYTDAATGSSIPRQVIDPASLRTHLADSDDNDDDYLPDGWESLRGLNPNDNGLIDARQGEYGDYDADLLTNHEEWLLGTNPCNADSDGDGYDDHRELEFFGSDPTVADLAPPTIVQQVNLGSYTTATGDWYLNAQGGLSSAVRRGELTYTLNVAEAGVHLLEITGRPEGTLEAVEEMPVVVSIDGDLLARAVLRSVNGAQGRIELLTPWLSAGTHALTIVNDNYKARLTLRIDSVSLLKPAGVDANSNGIPDWVDKQLQNGNGSTVCPIVSLVSPVCIEGKARTFEQLAITAGGDAVAVQQGIATGWYADIDLLAPVINEAGEAQLTVATPLDISFESGLISEQHDISWVPTDVLSAPDMVIRKGDSLRLTGLMQGISDLYKIKVTLSIDGQLIATDFKASLPRVHVFDIPGEHAITVSCRHGNNIVSGSMLVTVKDADLGPDFHVLADNTRVWELPGVDEGIHLEADPLMGFLEIEPTAAGTRRFRVIPNGPGASRVLARMEDGGPVIDHADVHAYRSYRTDATGDIKVLQTFPNGDRIVLMSVVLPDGFPPGGYITLNIFAAGVTFLDGTVIKVLTAADFINGIAYVKFNFPAEQRGSVCHDLMMYDGDGNIIGQQ